jgi:pyruvate formate lyase activating enzyme
MRLSPVQYLLVGLSHLTAALLIAGFFISKSPNPFSLVPVNGRFAREAAFWSRADLGVQCVLCPFNCYLTEGARGRCRVRMNRGGALYTMVYGQAVSLNLDPIEKKPVFHMLPGTGILSFATVGCPLRCSFCQNWSLSQVYPEQAGKGDILTPEAIVAAAVNNRIPSIAYTYGEPAVFYEYMYDTAKLAKKRGLRNVVVTSGYINREPLLRLAPYLDVVKVDLKGIRAEFYESEVGGYLPAVLDTLKLLAKTGVQVEVVNLVVPGRNDSAEDFNQLAKWVRDNMGKDTPLFFSRFHPDYRLKNLPPTPIATLEMARKIALAVGLRYVYLGNVPGHPAESTYCPDDGTLLIERSGFQVGRISLVGGKCPKCGRKIPGIWR